MPNMKFNGRWFHVDYDGARTRLDASSRQYVGSAWDVKERASARGARLLALASRSNTRALRQSTPPSAPRRWLPVHLIVAPFLMVIAAECLIDVITKPMPLAMRLVEAAAGVGLAAWSVYPAWPFWRRRDGGSMGSKWSESRPIG